MSDSNAGIEQPEPRPSIRPNTRPIRRTRTVLYTDAEWQLVQEAARLSGKTASGLIRDASLGVPVRAKPFLANAELIRELGKSGMALTHLAALAREKGTLPEAGRLETALAELLAVVRRIAASRT